MMSKIENQYKDRPLRIAFVDYVLEPDKPGRSGLSDIVWDMASALVDLGHQPHVIASYATDLFPDPRVTVHNFKAPPMGYRNIVGNIWLLKRAADIAKKLKPDIIHAPEYVSTAVLASLGVKCPLVLTVPGNIYHRIKYGHGFEWYFVQVLKRAATVSVRRCSAVIAVSQEMKRWWEMTGSLPECTPWIPYGVNMDRFHPVAGTREIIGLPENKLIFLYVGRFAIEKGLLDLIDAVGLLSTKFDFNQTQFILIGRGSMRAAMEERIVTHNLENIITIRDWVDQSHLATWYSAVDLLVMPSWNEPFGKVMLESMACGTAVISSRTEGPLDHISYGQNGWLFPTHDLNKLAEILEDRIRNPQDLDIIGNNAWKYVEANLTWQKITQRKVDEVYRKVLNAS